MFRKQLFVAVAAAVAVLPLSGGSHTQVIAHRGASGYLPEHTLEAAAYAYASGADYIEQDVVLSRDGVLVVSHDIHIDTTTDVAARHPARRRPDGRFYAIDFDWAELRQLAVRERVDPATGSQVYPGRFPSAPGEGGAFRLCTMEEQVVLIQGLNRSTGRKVGVYPEVKAPRWHRGQGGDPSRALLELLARHGYLHKSDAAIVQCFDPAELKRMRGELGTQLTLVQLIGDNDDEDAAADYVRMRTPEGLREVSTYAQGIGPHWSHLLAAAPDGRHYVFTDLMRDARAASLMVHPYTVRADALPPGLPSVDAFLNLLDQAPGGLDGMFVDFPDLAVRWRQARPAAK